MSTQFIHIVLLLAIVCSQILGGFSRCCLSRAIATGWSNGTEALSVSEQVDTSDAGEQAVVVPKCPRCAARVLLATNTGSVANNLAMEVVEDYPCRCSKFVASLGVQNEPVALDAPTPTLTLLLVDWKAVLSAQLSISAARATDVSLHFSGHSWQSFACVWKN